MFDITLPNITARLNGEEISRESISRIAKEIGHEMGKNTVDGLDLDICRIENKLKRLENG